MNTTTARVETTAPYYVVSEDSGKLRIVGLGGEHTTHRAFTVGMTGFQDRTPTGWSVTYNPMVMVFPASRDGIRADIDTDELRELADIIDRARTKLGAILNG